MMKKILGALVKVACVIAAFYLLVLITAWL